MRETCDFARDCTTGTLVTDESHRQDLAKLAGPWGKHMKTEVGALDSRASSPLILLTGLFHFYAALL